MSQELYQDACAAWHRIIDLTENPPVHTPYAVIAREVHRYNWYAMMQADYPKPLPHTVPEEGAAMLERLQRQVVIERLLGSEPNDKYKLLIRLIVSERLST